MITVAVIAILGAIAYPNYVESMRKSKRAEARVAIMEVMQQQERYATQYNKYLPFDAGNSSVSMKTYSGNSGKDAAAFLIKAEACPKQDISICVLVTGLPQYTDPSVTSISITSSGVKSCNGTSSTDCWK